MWHQCVLIATSQATCALDGMVRIYEAVDLMNLSVWHLTEEFEADQVTHMADTAQCFTPSLEGLLLSVLVSLSVRFHNDGGGQPKLCPGVGVQRKLPEVAGSMRVACSQGHSSRRCLGTKHGKVGWIM